MDVNHGFAQVGVAEQQLDGAQVGSGFEEMSGEAVAKSVRMQRLVDSGAFGGFPAGVPDDLVADGVIGRVPATAREQPNGRFAGQPAIMCAQFAVQMGLSTISRSLPPLPSWTCTTMRAESISVSLRDAHSARRTPVP